MGCMGYVCECSGNVMENMSCQDLVKIQYAFWFHGCMLCFSGHYFKDRCGHVWTRLVQMHFSARGFDGTMVKAGQTRHSRLPDTQNRHTMLGHEPVRKDTVDCFRGVKSLFLPLSSAPMLAE